MGCQLLLHEAIGSLVLPSIPLNFPMWYYVLANEKCTGKSVTFALELFILGNKYPFIEMYKM